VYYPDQSDIKMCGRKLVKFETTTLNLSLAVNPLKT